MSIKFRIIFFLIILSKIFLIHFLFATNTSNTNISSDINKKSKTNNTNQNKTQIPKQTNITEPDKPILLFKNGDLKALFSCSMKVEYILYKNMKFLNNQIPDEFRFFKQTTDLMLDVAYGKKQFGHKAVQLYTDLRCKTKWGVKGDYRSTAQTEIKVGSTSLGFHEHRNARPFPWFKDAWLQASFNSAFDLKTKNLHFIKAGWFPYQLGRGIALGPYYATADENLGTYSYIADASAPGINICGEIIKNKLIYDLYYAKFEDNSAYLRDTLNTLKANHVGKENPWRGVAKDDELWSARLRWKAIKNYKKGDLDFEPYIFYNEMSDQYVEVPNDSKTMLGAYGLAINYKKRVFEIGGEIAFNYGKEKLYSIDRNQIVIRKWDATDSGTVPFSDTDLQNALYEANSYVVFSQNADPSIQGKEAPATNLVNSLAQKYQLYPVNIPYPADANHAEYLQNKTGRIRPAFKNDLNGFMAVIDASYIIEGCDLQFGIEYIFTSGDFNPNYEERDKKYKGFIGRHEQYSGRKIISAIIAGEREINIPSSLPAGQKEIADNFRASVNNMALTDLHVLGLSVKWFPEIVKNKRLVLNPNIIFYNKDHESYKYVIDPTNINNNGTSATEKARRFVGTELNIVSSYNLVTDLYVNAAFSVFIPGGFYKDIKGVPIYPDYYLDVLPIKPDPKYIESYRMAADNVYFVDISLTYKF